MYGSRFPVVVLTTVLIVFNGCSSGSDADGVDRSVGSSPAGTTGSMTLSGSSWEVIAYNNGEQAIVTVLGGTQITASFGQDGRVTGTAGCNNYFAGYEITGESISIGLPGATRRFCSEPEGTMDQEAHFLEALQSAAAFRLAGNKLSLRHADGLLAVTLLRDTPLTLTMGSP